LAYLAFSCLHGINDDRSFIADELFHQAQTAQGEAVHGDMLRKAVTGSQLFAYHFRHAPADAIIT
jgi:hypothetical protein